MEHTCRLRKTGGPADAPGFQVGHATATNALTGLSVILCPPETTGGMDVRGSAPGTRQTDGLAPDHLVNRVHAVLLTGGSAFGLDAAGGVAGWLARRGIGVPAGPALVPIVPTAVLFDLAISSDGVRPDAAMAEAACEAATDGELARGCVGAGAGATIGKLFGLPRATKGGLGGASLQVGDLTVGAMAVVNAFGDIVGPDGLLVAGARLAEDSRELINTSAWFLEGNQRESFVPVSNTTLGVVTTNARLDKVQACKVAALAHHGLVRSINPVHTRFDGDLIFVLSAGEQEADVNGLGIMAATVMKHAVWDAVYSATPAAGLPVASQITPLATRF